MVEVGYSSEEQEREADRDLEASRRSAVGAPSRRAFFYGQAAISCRTATHARQVSHVANAGGGALGAWIAASIAGGVRDARAGTNDGERGNRRVLHGANVRGCRGVPREDNGGSRGGFVFVRLRCGSRNGSRHGGALAHASRGARCAGDQRERESREIYLGRSVFDETRTGRRGIP